MLTGSGTGALTVSVMCAVLFLRRPKCVARAIYMAQTHTYSACMFCIYGLYDCIAPSRFYRLAAAALTRPWAADGVKWWMLLGGIPGSTGTITTVFLTKHLSATVHNTLTTAGSLFGSMCFDSFGSFGAAKRPTTWLRVLSVALAFAGSALTKEPFGRADEHAAEQTAVEVLAETETETRAAAHKATESTKGQAEHKQAEEEDAAVKGVAPEEEPGASSMGAVEQEDVAEHGDDRERQRQPEGESERCSGA